MEAQFSEMAKVKNLHSSLHRRGWNGWREEDRYRAWFSPFFAWSSPFPDSGKSLSGSQEKPRRNRWGKGGDGFLPCRCSQSLLRKIALGILASKGALDYCCHCFPFVVWASHSGSSEDIKGARMKAKVLLCRYEPLERGRFCGRDITFLPHGKGLEDSQKSTTGATLRQGDRLLNQIQQAWRNEEGNLYETWTYLGE